jgi:hypothetical protein
MNSHTNPKSVFQNNVSQTLKTLNLKELESVSAGINQPQRSIIRSLTVNFQY